MPPEMPTPALCRMVYNGFAKDIHAALAIETPGFRPAHGNVLEHLNISDGLRLTDIAEAAGMTPQSIGELVDQLEELGYVERRPDPEDRRAKRIYMTETARGYTTTVARVLEAIERQIEAVLGARGRQSLRRALQKVLDARG